MNKFTPILSGLLLAVSASSVADPFDSMHKQLSIMSKIIKSSLAGQSGRNRSEISNVESVYLKGQGVVFTINSSSRSSQWGNFNFNFVMPEVPEVPEIPDVGDIDVNIEGDTHIEFNETISDAMEKAQESYERAMENFSNERESIRELRDQQRDLSYQVRDLEREKRDLEYQLRHADKESKNDLSKEVAKLEQQKKEIEQTREKLKAKSAELRKHQMAEKQQREQERGQYYKALTASLVESFCLYGNGLKAVPKNEHVSLIVKAAGEKENNRYKDMIYVFNKKDITDCATDKITSDALIAKGQGYQF